MEISRTDDALILDALDLFLVELLRQIPASADPEDNSAARERLWSKPSSSDKQLNEDWETYVQPDLLEGFQKANQTVQSDLDTCLDGGGETGTEDYCLRIPKPHFEEWLNSLNQARLALAARNGFSEKELERHLPASLDSAREMNLFQIHLYGLIQEFLVRELN